MTLRGATINSSSSSGYVLRVVNADDVTIDRVTVNGGRIAIGVHMSDGTVISNSKINDVIYAGVLTTGLTNGRIVGNRIDGVQGDPGSGPWNGYGITLSYTSGSGDTTDTVVENNTISHVPTWHGLDTHGGDRVTFRNNTVSGARRALFLTGSPTAVLAEDNHFTAPTSAERADCPSGAPQSYCDDIRGISTAGGNGTIRNNTGVNWGSRWWNDISGMSNYTKSGNNPN
jgi:hypothetical protein